MEFNHISVLLTECIEGLNINPDGTYIDATLGGGGHSKHICKHLSSQGKFIGFDRDIEALTFAKGVLAGFDIQKIFVHDNFSSIPEFLDEPVDGVLMDLGVSSFQLDTASRGFSYTKDAPLDMRMNVSDDLSAYDVVNSYKEEDLYAIIKNYGEERFAKSIARSITKQRDVAPIKTTMELVEIIRKSMPRPRDGSHPAKRTFQAIRIEVNNELGIIEDTINGIVDKLNSGGRLCIITFHSLEDRIVKTAFNQLKSPCTCPREFPVCICKKEPQIKIISKKPILPTSGEMEQNPRSKSAKLRIAEKL